MIFCVWFMGVAGIALLVLLSLCLWNVVHSRMLVGALNEHCDGHIVVYKKYSGSCQKGEGRRR